ncbi:protein-disulfide reductase DsbD family protein [Methylobacterium haplocladii]|uniref:Thiol:disulfide interchange protein DsbD n=1 Tax=Methylobacterium haplocladii TaxID=1176176 RepID=A0A512IU18_9HYPH|nr:protein-disulfide reductase DsbD domain-containing protein [Methylobacterium haplocladii]GEP01202.1 thiol:disulfide interchange protein DsbD [Methylobacterium haplocladii]GJD86323.1 Thiol:disulfide interchange protein DsbD [Methylobacterium haplocladii]GLS61391.1 thiol:disulfide interchange protein DsbD [Methylobacterium haplocladii]
MIRLFTAFALLLGALAGAQALVPKQPKDLVQASLVAEPSAVAPGSTAAVGIRMAMKPGWHVYWRNPGDSGLPPEMAWDLPRGVGVGPVQWPAPERLPVQTLMNYGYEGEVVLLVPVSVPKDYSGTSVRLAGKLSYLVCEEICIPGSADLELSLPVAAADAPPTPDPASTELFAKARAALPEPSPWPSRLSRQGDTVVLSLDRTGLAPDAIGEAAFFPYGETVLDNAASQTLTVDAAGLHLALKPGDAAKPPTDLPGVLTFTENGRRRAFAIGEPPPAAAAPSEAAPATAPTPVPAEDESLTLWSAAGLALLGGLVLNLMPCVFPVLSIKVLSLVKQAGQSTTRVRIHGLAYTAGVLASFLALAGLLMALKAGGATIGWGFQLQSPIVVAVLAYGLLAMGLSLSGVVHLGGGIAGLGDGLTRRAGYQGSFFTGVLATLVATPCTAPFMGAAVGYALTQPPAVSLIVFASLGLGLALPFLALTLFPGALRIMPRPGAWMDTLKGVLAFPVYAAVAWLIWVLAQQVGPNGLLAGLSGLVLVGFAAWAWERARLGSGWGGTLARATALAALIATAGLVAVLDGDRAVAGSTATAEGIEPFTQARLDALRGEGRTVFVDMTAAWCITCQINERTALSRDGVKAAFRANGVVVLRGDWTNQNPEITTLLERYGRSGVPLYLLYRGKAEASVLPQILTEGVVLAAIEKRAGLAQR